MTQGANFATSTAGVVNTGGKFATGVNNAMPVQNVPNPFSSCQLNHP
jgi:hypothetical protein